MQKAKTWFILWIVSLAVPAWLIRTYEIYTRVIHNIDGPISISNMHCSNCSMAVEKHFNALDDIKVNVILSDNLGLFTYDDASWDEKKIEKHLKSMVAASNEMKNKLGQANNEQAKDLNNKAQATSSKALNNAGVVKNQNSTNQGGNQ